MRNWRTTLTGLSVAAMVGGCVFGGGDHNPAPPTRPRGAAPIRLNLPQSNATKQCFADLTRAGVRYTPLPDTDYGGGCQVIGAIRLDDIGVPVGGLTAMRCPLAEAFFGWVKNAVAPAAHQMLGSDLVRIESLGTYACRGVIGQGAAASAKLSEHGLANAVDIASFVLADGRRITIERDWRSGDPRVRQFLDVIHGSACKRFKTVLSPDYNAAHHNHLHLDMGRGPMCR